MLVRRVDPRLFTRFDRGLRFPWKNKQTKTKQAGPKNLIQPHKNNRLMAYRESPLTPERGTGFSGLMYVKRKGFH